MGEPETIVLYHTPGGWVAWFSRWVPDVGEHALWPTAFTATCPAERVRAEIQALNPDCVVRLAREVPHA